MQEYSKFLPAFTPYILHFTLYTLHPRGHTIPLQYPCNTVTTPIPLRYHSEPLPKELRKNSEGRAKRCRALVAKNSEGRAKLNESKTTLAQR